MKLLTIFFLLSLCTITAQPLAVSPASLSFSQLAGQTGGVGTVSSIEVTSANTTNFIVSASSQGTWLSVLGQNVVFGDNTFGTWESTTPYSVGVFVDGTGLSTGIYTGSVVIATCTIDSSGAIQTYGNPINIPVTLTIASTPTFSITPTSLFFSFQPGANSLMPATQTQQINVGLSGPGSPSSFIYTAAVSDGTWLSANSITGGIIPGVINVTANPASLSPGTYSADVMITISATDITLCPGGTFTPCVIGNPITVPVMLSIAQPTLTLSANSLSFDCQVGGAVPASQVIEVSSSLSLYYSVSSNAAWLSTSPTNGSTNANLIVSVNPAGLKVGNYQGTLSITGTGTSNSPQTVSVALSVDENQATVTAITNAASYGIPASGGAATIFGTFPDVSIESATATPLRTVLGGVTVFIDGIPTPLYYVSSSQINVQIPWEVGMDQNATIDVTNGVWNATMNANIQSSSPGIFEIDSNHDGAILHSDYSLVTAAHPAVPGETVLIYATGLGPVSPSQVDGVAASVDELASTMATSTVQIGSKTAPVSFSGLAPGFVGLYQINAVVPMMSAESIGNNPITLTINGTVSSAVMIAIGQP